MKYLIYRECAFHFLCLQNIKDIPENFHYAYDAKNASHFTLLQSRYILKLGRQIHFPYNFRKIISINEIYSI